MMSYDKEVYATLKIASSILSAKDIGTILGMSPSKSYEKGEVFGRRSPRVIEESIWFFESQISRYEPIEDHIKYLLKLLRDKMEQIESLSKDCDITILGFYSTETGQGGICLSHELVCQIAQLPIDLIFDLHLSDSGD